MNRLISPGIYALVVTLLAGAWLVISPWVTQTQRAGSVWSPGTVNNLATGGILIAVSVLGIALILALTLRDLVRAAQQRALDQADERP